MEKLLNQIETADKEKINELVDAVIKRYGNLYPDWEISTISVKKNKNRNEQLDAMIRVLENMKTVN